MRLILIFILSFAALAENVHADFSNTLSPLAPSISQLRLARHYTCSEILDPADDSEKIFTMGRTSPNEMQTYLEEIEVLGRRIRDSAKKDVRGTVFYPFVGTDAALALRLFPQASSYVFLDQRPFLSADYQATVPTLRGIFGFHSMRGWRAEDEINTTDKFLGPRILGNLKQAWPDLTIEQITLYENNRMNRYAPDVHAVIEISGGPVAEHRQIHFIQGKIPSRADIQMPGDWKEWIHSLRDIEAVIIKAANGKISEKTLHPEFREILVDSLSRSKGVLVSGFSQASSDPEFSLPEKEYARTWSQDFYNYPFGYGNRVRVTHWGMD